MEGAEDKIYEGFAWLSLPYDEGGQKGGPYAPYHQSERLPIYHKYVAELVDKGHAYHCFCSKERLDEMRKAQQASGGLPKYDRLCRSLPKSEVEARLAAGEPHVVRMKIPDSVTLSWVDIVRGEVSFSSNDVDDQVILKSDKFPTYHLAVVVDDHLMKITHVIRGEEWISSTPKHLLLYQYFGWELPAFAHMPLIRNPDHSKLSKRKNDVSILSYRDRGYLPEALMNFLCLLGWSHPEGKEIFSFAEFLKLVSWSRIQKTAPVFDLKKLDWMNGMYIRQLPLEELARRVTSFLPEDFPVGRLTQLLPLVQERLVTLKDLEPLTEFFYRPIHPDPQAVLKKSTPADVTVEIESTIERLTNLKDWNLADIEACIRGLQEEKSWSKGQYFMMVRLAVTGQTATPPLFETIQVMGREMVMERLAEALKLVKS